ncbi:MAG: prepilin-type N-terminal cleavage/methylation domain-containing protein [Gammaproteobacteria bacterium]|jgi:prepilin-type N-terminal cleavage/methylation domain-containing protein|nr:prepilin-type N-terminal cleavage/methylation domain-containing protein [Gammaproteobacteria bacterium]
MKHTRHRAHNQGGWTLLELLVTIIVVAVLTAGVLLLYRQATGAANTARAEDLLTSIQASVHEIYADENSYSTLDSSVLSGGSLSADRRDPWGGTIHVRPTAGGHHFTISFGRVPHTACLRLGASPVDGGWTSLSINQVGVYDGTQPPNPGAVLSACRSATHDRLTWTSS